MKDWKLPVGLIVIIIFAWLTSWGLISNFIEAPGDRGVFGDMFGAVNSLFSGLAFAGLIYTILLQKNELGLQRQELELTRRELKGQKEAMEAQNKQIELQSFEGTFFQMLKLHNELLDSIEFRNRNDGSYKARDCFSIVWKEKRDKLTRSYCDNSKERREEIKTGYSELWDMYESNFGHYFRSLYTIIKFIDNAKIENRKHYANIVRAQLSSHELLLMYYNCIYFDASKFKPFIEKYALLKHLPGFEIQEKMDFDFYKSSAFGSNCQRIKKQTGFYLYI